VLPSVWVSQVDVNLFGAGAWLDSGYLRSVGGSVTLSTIWGQETPIALTYQFAYRFDDNLPPLHLVYLSF